MFLWFMQPDIWLTLITLTFLEIILGVDNIIFLSLVVAKLPLSQQNMARKLGLSCAMIMRILLLISIAWLSHITQPLFTVLTLIMIAAVMIAVGVMMFAAKTIGDFVNATPSIKILALTFLLFVGVLLVADSLNIHIAKEYLYFAIFFSLSVETLNIIRERKNKKVSTLLETHESHSH